MARNKSNAEGSVYYVESKRRWEAMLTIGWKDAVDKDGNPKFDANGDRMRSPVRRSFTGKTQKDVARRLAEAKKSMTDGLELPDDKRTIAQYAEWWLAEVMPSEGLAPATVTFYERLTRNYVTSDDYSVASKTLTGPRALTPADVESLMKAMAANNLSPRSQAGARTVLSKMLQAAAKRGLVARNVARLANTPGDSGAARKVKALTPAEVRELLEKLEGTRWHDVALIGVTTGLRPGELLGLHWADVHLDAAEPYLSVRISMSNVNGPALKAPKRARSYRVVHFAPETASAFERRRELQNDDRTAAGPEWSPNWPDLVFTTEVGTPVLNDSFRRAIGRLTPGVHPWRLRHTYATHLLEAGHPIHHVAEVLGDTVAVVEATYSHVLKPKANMVSTVSSILG